MTKTTKNIMFLGTGSDVGKSIVAAAFCRILKRRGFRTAPFKAQNMSNNSYVTMEGGEIGRAQVVQAEAAGLIPSSDMNPVLLKPSSGLGAQIVLQGQVYGQMSAAEYHKYKIKLLEAVMDSYQRLADKYEIIVMEGAGSCVELNLKKNDLVNFNMAKRVEAPCVLVADIDRGGIFAQTIGSYLLMTPKEKKLTTGFIVNKFRGDPALFTDGLDIIRQRTGRSVFGVAPFYEDIHIDPEDSVAVQADKRRLTPPRPDRVNTAVIKLPGISNFTDLEPLEREADVIVNYLHQPEALDGYDWLVLPGTKNTMEDAAWLNRSGWSRRIKAYAAAGGPVLGICGGYQILGRRLFDPLGVESDRGRVNGLGLLPLTTTMAGEKIVRKVTGVDLCYDSKITGYEIHMGQTELSGSDREIEEVKPFLRIHPPGDRTSWEDGFYLDQGRIIGCYVHGVLDQPGFRRIVLNRLRQAKGLPERKRTAPARAGRFHQYDKLADHFEQHTDVEAILKVIGL